uniref:Uncharacterized protein n=1 Tax=Spermophilus dauricus TaxID=99837 RepID=A0A8C9Q4U7_SPEDA
VEKPSWALEEEQIRASWLPYSLQLPGFLIDGDYYIIDLLDRTVPALGTLCPLLKACCRTWHLQPRACCPALPAPQALSPSRGGIPEPPSLVAWGRSRRRLLGLRPGEAPPFLASGASGWGH